MGAELFRLKIRDFSGQGCQRHPEKLVTSRDFIRNDTQTIPDLDTTCEYCHNSMTLLAGHVYCSNHGPAMESLESGAIFSRANELDTSEHVSRLSIRYNFSGQQDFQVGNRSFRLTPENYLLINQGQRYRTKMKSANPHQILAVCFKPDLAEKLYFQLTNAQEVLLDNPDKAPKEQVLFFEQTFQNDPYISSQLLKLKQAFDSSDQSQLDLEDLYTGLLERLLCLHLDVYKWLSKMDPVKTSTKVELFRRLNIARDYITANYKDNISLDEIASMACLSKYHFLRLFKSVYKTTPHKYLTEFRLKKARQLLTISGMPVNEICTSVGFQDPSSFGRLFKRHFGVTPANFRGVLS